MNLVKINVCHDHEYTSVFSIGNPHLLSIEDPVFSILLGTGLQGKGISTTASLRETVATQLSKETTRSFIVGINGPFNKNSCFKSAPTLGLL